jgi:hypothetical protein
MPAYSYRDKDGNLVEVVMTYAEKCRREKDGRLMNDGMELTRDVAADHAMSPSTSAGWPMYSDAAAVHPDIVPQVKSDLYSKGVSVDFDRNGRPKFDNAAHRRAALRAMGMHDRRGYD